MTHFLPRLIGLVLTGTLLAAPGFAQNTVGRSMVDGKPVTLLDDGTWVFTDEADAANAACFPAMGSVRFCGKGLGYKQLDFSQNPQIDLAVTRDERTYGMFIIERFGTEDGVTLDRMVRTPVANAALITGVPESEIPVFDTYDIEVDGAPGKTVVYKLNLNGLDLIYYATVRVDAALTVQAISYFVGKEPRDEFKAQHAAVIDALTVGE